MVTVINRINQTKQPSTARIVQGDLSTQGRHCARTKTTCGSNKVEQRLAARVARADRRKSGHKLGTHRKANKLSRHQESTETNQVAAPTWLAVKVRQNGKSLKVGCGNLIGNDGKGTSGELLDGAE